MKNKILMSLAVAFIISIIVAIMCEWVEAKLELGIVGAVLLSIPVFFMGIIVDRLLAKKEFKKRVFAIVKDLSTKKIKGELTSVQVQSVMEHSIKEIAELLHQYKHSDDGNFPKERRIEWDCKICHEKHVTDENLKCTKCNLHADKWSYLNIELQKSN